MDPVVTWEVTSVDSITAWRYKFMLSIESTVPPPHSAAGMVSTATKLTSSLSEIVPSSLQSFPVASDLWTPTKQSLVYNQLSI